MKQHMASMLVCTPDVSSCNLEISCQKTRFLLDSGITWLHVAVCLQEGHILQHQRGGEYNNSLEGKSSKLSPDYMKPPTPPRSSKALVMDAITRIFWPIIQDVDQQPNANRHQGVHGKGPRGMVPAATVASSGRGPKKKRASLGNSLSWLFWCKWKPKCSFKMFQEWLSAARVLSHHTSLHSTSCNKQQVQVHALTRKFWCVTVSSLLLNLFLRRHIRKEATSILDWQGANQCKTQPDDSSTTEINVQ